MTKAASRNSPPLEPPKLGSDCPGLTAPRAGVHDPIGSTFGGCEGGSCSSFRSFQGSAMTALPPDVMSVPQRARRLGVSTWTAYRLAEKGELPGAFKVGAQWRVSVPRFEREIHGEPTP
jgi:excisionase family DNA binding protein